MIGKDMYLRSMAYKESGRGRLLPPAELRAYARTTTLQRKQHGICPEGEDAAPHTAYIVEYFTVDMPP